jgi:tRNA(Ile)-lysidine synthetase-like protein
MLGLSHWEAVDALLGEGRPNRRAPTPGPVVFARSYRYLWALRRDAVEGPVEPPPLDGVRAGWAQDPSQVPLGAVGIAVASPGARLRPWSPGDRVWVGGAARKVKDLLMAARLEPWRRRQAWVVEVDGQGVGLLAPGRAWGGEAGGFTTLWVRYG